jgi:enolase
MIKNYKIKSLKAREILDSRGIPTLEAILNTNLGTFRASIPSGTSKGKYEATAKLAKIAINNINKIIAPKLKGRELIYQKKIDEFLVKLDGTKNKSKLGANAILAVSIAVCRAGAAAKNLPLWRWISRLSGTRFSIPIPCFLFMEGGLHGGGNLDIQEFMIVFPGKSFRERFNKAKVAFRNLGKLLPKKYGMEGAFSPNLKETEKALDLLMKVGEKNKAKIILDVAASHFHSKKKPEYYLNLAKDYPILAIEDPFPQDDWQNWKKLNSKLLIIGDDLTVTNPNRIKLAHRRRACRGVVIKPNQIGTVTETIKAAKLAKSFGWKIIVSHRSGETLDDFIADLAAGIGADFIKSGAPFPKERMAKYNRLVKIEEETYG